MTKIKLCGLSRAEDILTANKLSPEYVGFVFAENSRRRVKEQTAKELKKMLDPAICAVGVFVNAPAEQVLKLLECGIIDIAQLHGGESEEYILKIKTLSGKPVIKAFSVNGADDIIAANNSAADYILLDCGRGGSGKQFDYKFLKNVSRSYFLAGGLNAQNVGDAVKRFKPFAVDVSSGIETAGVKDKFKIEKFVRAVRSACGREE